MHLIMLFSVVSGDIKKTEIEKLANKWFLPIPKRRHKK